ncbi:MAG: hypothetical protein F4X04_14595 [Holophagales bacterium]|nr:hypothetical protein [Holophagales bacterium]
MPFPLRGGAAASSGNGGDSGDSNSDYVLPQATEGALGGVRGATQAQAGATGATILGWSAARIRQLIVAALPTVSASDAAAGSSAARRVWTAQRVRSAIRAVFTTSIETLIRGALQRSGGTLTGALTLSGAPSADLEAATKKYVDDNAGLPLTGGTLTGALTLSGAPSADLHAATKKYVDDNAGGDGTATGTIEARVERVNFDDLATGQTEVELTPNALSVVNGAGGNEFLSNISGNDFTLGAGVYLVNIHAVFTFANTQSSAWFELRRASDNAALDQSNPIYARFTDATPWSGRMLVILAADTAVNLFAHRSSNSAMTAFHAEIVKLSSGGAVHSAHNRYVGWAAQQTPMSSEITAGDTFTTDVLTIPAEADDGDGWLWFAVPDSAGAPSAAYFDGNTHDILGGFTRLASGTFAGHIVYASNVEQDPAILGTGSRTITLEYD